jgi:endogenous inhibitor of DNA gyrase (YacG/DUF329 family)
MEFTPRCPVCREIVQWDGNASRPFCSERCQLIDLGSWATEKYRVPGAVAEIEVERLDDDESDEGGT